jgi:hypothetical protein
MPASAFWWAVVRPLSRGYHMVNGCSFRDRKASQPGSGAIAMPT